MHNRNILVTGGHGMLGYNLVLSLSNFFSEFNIYYTYRGDNKNIYFNPNIFPVNCDLTKKMELVNILTDINPSIIIHTAAIVDLLACEKNVDLAKYIHSDIIEIFYENNPNSKLIYISTDSIFDGIEGDYSELSIPNPINNYSKTKLIGENMSYKLFHNSIIIRTNIYGLHVGQEKSSLSEWALSNLNSNNIITGYENVFFNPVYIGQLSNAIILLIEKEFFGIINIASNTYISKYEFLILLSKKFNLNSDLIEKGLYYNINSLVKRPLITTLKTSLFTKIFNKSYTIEDGLNHLFKDYKIKQNGRP